MIKSDCIETIHAPTTRNRYRRPQRCGKSTIAPVVLRDYLTIPDFVNADQIAVSLSAFNPENVAFEAGRIMLQRIEELANAGGKDFKQALNPHAKEVITAYLEQGMRHAMPDEKFQFERHGYFVADRVDHLTGRPVFNRVVTLKDSWGK